MEIEHLCRKYSYKELRDSPYDKRLEEILSSIEVRYSEYLKAGNGNELAIVSLKDEIEKEDIEEEKGLFKRIFRRNGKKQLYSGDADLEKITRFGEEMLKKKRGIVDMKRSIEKSYNAHCTLIRTVEQSFEMTRSLITEYEEQKKRIEAEIIEMHELHSDSSKLESFIDGLIKSKEEAGKMSANELVNLKKYLIEKGKEKLEDLSGEYQEIENDLAIASRIFAYREFVEKANQMADSLFSVRKRLLEDLTKIEEIIVLYDIITKKQIDFLSDAAVPESYVGALNKLVSQIEEIDEEFSKRLLKAVFSEGISSQIMNIRFSKVTHDLVSHIVKEEKETLNADDGGVENDKIL